MQPLDNICFDEILEIFEYLKNISQESPNIEVALKDFDITF